MKTKKQSVITYSIAVTIAVAIGTQLYWNIQNYRENQKYFVNDVQIALDNSLERYYSELGKNQMVISDSGAFAWGLHNSLMDEHIFPTLPDDIFFDMGFKSPDQSSQLSERTVYSNLLSLAQRITSSLSGHFLDLKRLDSILISELDRKNISIKHGLNHYSYGTIEAFRTGKLQGKTLRTFSKSTYLKDREKIEIVFENPPLLILRRGMAGILLSLSIAACLFYLLRTIRRQKQLSEVKNDLINNITHEFKTPITTLGIALEGVKNFNAQGELDKSHRYLDISGQQLQKLRLMIEKLLETAALNTNELPLDEKNIDLKPVLEALVEKYKMLAGHKRIVFSSNAPEAWVLADGFHIENAVTNLLDNAVKYGGDRIELTLRDTPDHVEIIVSDNGKGIEKAYKNKIFDQFYRIPMGNVHNVKGFGIGLYYSKNIVEKHKGSLRLVSGEGGATFKIILWKK